MSMTNLAMSVASPEWQVSRQTMRYFLGMKPYAICIEGTVTSFVHSDRMMTVLPNHYMPVVDIGLKVNNI